MNDHCYEVSSINLHLVAEYPRIFHMGLVFLGPTDCGDEFVTNDKDFLQNFLAGYFFNGLTSSQELFIGYMLQQQTLIWALNLYMWLKKKKWGS